ncbi:hypothetical protein [Catellatospora citrea]|uniref:Uncharacterized protein n=1 Tax=Catellatospora citrea TaxID=53366 RepID=A0A8J3P2R8_9ACTN|nr:hypothetical protein [Catellatospora citrea]RKE08472.1 hypothetical protein C8E86_3324 [Catellatospora citrea]GIG01442.1 hypothetical protein Cci01nite_65350 [Catellatospora citrea]
MNIDLEDELATGMREHTADLKPSADLLDRAARRNRRRTAAMASGTGVFALAAVVAVAMTALGGTPAAPPVEPGAPPAPELLTVAMVQERAVAALAADDVQHIVQTVTYRGTTDHGEWWFDQVTGDSHITHLQAPGGAVQMDLWQLVRDDKLTMTQVFHGDRSYVVHERPLDGQHPVGPAGSTPDELRAALRRGEGYTLVGPEDLDGRAVLHLRYDFEDGTDELWVDAQTYRAVRRETVKHTPDGDSRNRMDFTWQARDAESLKPLAVKVPDGYTQRELPPIDGPV